MGCVASMPRSLPVNLTRLCPDLTPLEEGSGAAITRKLVEVSELYYDCQRRHRALVESLSR
jgi:hypothetical protein